MAACFDEPGQIFDKNFCLDAISKDVKGRVKIAETLPIVCGENKCATFRTFGPLELKTLTEKCDSSLSHRLDGGTFVVKRLATAYEIDGLHRGVHAGDFVWIGQHVKIEGRMSGITNAGILRPPVFQGKCEACSTPGIMIGRLCGQVVGSAGKGLTGAQVVAVYRFKVGRPTRKGAYGTVIGTIEGVIAGPC